MLYILYIYNILYIYIYIYVAIWLSYIPINFQILQIFRTSFNISTLTEKKYICHGFSFFKWIISKFASDKKRFEKKNGDAPLRGVSGEIPNFLLKVLYGYICALRLP